MAWPSIVVLLCGEVVQLLLRPISIGVGLSARASPELPASRLPVEESRRRLPPPACLREARRGLRHLPASTWSSKL